MQLWNQRRLADKEGMPEQVQGRCCSIDDVYDARRVAEMLSIPYYVVNHQERFERDVIRPFVDEYLSGRTPIPCSLCNNHLKFDQLLLTARQIGAELIATGHYARNEYDPARARWILKRPADASKDQTYFLFGLAQEQLAHTLFPLGDFTKPEVRELARGYGLALAGKPDSQEICFIPGGDYKRFIEAYLEEQGEHPRADRSHARQDQDSPPPRARLGHHRARATRYRAPVPRAESAAEETTVPPKEKSSPSLTSPSAPSLRASPPSSTMAMRVVGGGRIILTWALFVHFVLLNPLNCDALQCAPE
jgi:hypothetical protein